MQMHAGRFSMTKRTWSRGWAALVLAGLAVGGASTAHAAEAGSRTPDGRATGGGGAVSRAAGEGSAAAVPRLASAKAQLEHATGLKKALRGAEGDARDAARKAAIDGYRAVREYFPDDAPACAEAAFRAGELLRASDDLTGAAAEFTIARDRGHGTDFRVRAMLEIGHLDRRAKRLQPALATYEAVVAEESASARQKDEASLWAGRVHADLEHYADARRVWQRVADKGDDPLDRIRAWDFLVSLLIDQGDLEGAAGVLERCRESLSEAAAEESKLGERVRAALASMRCIEDLARAIEKRRAAGDGSEKGKDPVSKTGKSKKSGSGT